MILERQMFDNFIYIFSDFSFEMENSVWITIYPYKVRNQNWGNATPTDPIGFHTVLLFSIFWFDIIFGCS